MGHNPFECLNCGQKFQHSPGADLHCGPQCAEEYAAAVAKAKQQLIELGFVPFTAAPNIWVRDYVAVTIEQVLNEGIDAVIESHTNAVREHQELRAAQA